MNLANARGRRRTPPAVIAFAVLALYLLLALAFSPPALGQSHHGSSTVRRLTTEEIAKATLPSVVSITVRGQNGQPALQGSGFVVGTNLIATNLHVVNGAHAVTANFQNGRSATVYGIVNVDVDHDLVLLYADTAGAKPLPLATDPDIPIGEPVVAVGSPEGLGGSISTGVVSGIRKDTGTKVIQTTAAISHGSSGGALIDRYGRVLGVTSYFLAGGENLNFAYPSYYLKLLIPKGAPSYVAWALLEDKLKGEWAINPPQPSDNGGTPPANAASGAAFTDKPLAGLHGVYVVVENLPTSAADGGLDVATIKSSAERILRDASIPVFDEDDSDLLSKDPSLAYLYINVNAVKSDSGQYSYNIDLAVEERVRLERSSPVSAQAGTWTDGGMGMVGQSDFADTVLSDLKDYVGHFTKDYNTQNPSSNN